MLSIWLQVVNGFGAFWRDGLSLICWMISEEKIMIGQPFGRLHVILFSIGGTRLTMMLSFISLLGHGRKWIA
jgi:hypothetical protein